MSEVIYARCNGCGKEEKMIQTGFMNRVRAPEGWETQLFEFNNRGLGGKACNKHWCPKCIKKGKVPEQTSWIKVTLYVAKIKVI